MNQNAASGLVPCPLSLALQGGGAHGAFTWGVLDCLLEDGRVRFDGVSGTSAGAMNAVVLAQGLMAGGNEGAREALSKFWHAVSASVPFDTLMPRVDGQGVALIPVMQAALQWTRFFSPAEWNPLGLNPLRKLVSEQIDFERLRAESPVQLFIAATNVNTGKLRLFHTQELGVEQVLASACLPTVHRTIEIDGQPYWDGAYSANPAVFPLIYECATRDILLVLLSPLRRRDMPESADEIRVRSLELAFSSTFLREMRMIAHARQFAADSTQPMGRLEERLTEARFHIVSSEELMNALPAESKMAAAESFLEMLFERGREHAQRWLQAHGDNLGKRASADIHELFF